MKNWVNRALSIMLCIFIGANLIPLQVFAQTEELEVSADNNQEEKIANDNGTSKETVGDVLESEDKKDEVDAKKDEVEAKKEEAETEKDEAETKKEEVETEKDYTDTDSVKKAPTARSLPEGLLIYFDMEELNAGKLKNLVDDVEFPVLGGNPQIVASGKDELGKALKLDGATNYLNVGTDYQVVDKYTIAAWVEVDENANGLSRVTGRARTGVSGEKDMALYIRKNNKALEHEGVTGFAANEVVNIGEWQHVAVTFADTSLKLYVNGQLISMKTVSGDQDMTNDEIALLIGAGWNGTGDAPFGGHMFKGLMDEFRFYDVALSGEEIGALAFAEDSGGGADGDAELVFNFNMDEILDGSGANTGKKVIVNSVDSAEYPIYGGATVNDFGIYGKSIAFDGSTAYANLGKPDIREKYTFSSWVYIGDGSNSLNKIFGRDKTTVGKEMFYFCVRNNGNIEYVVSDNTNKSYGVSGGIGKFSFNDWCHIAVTSDDLYVTLYLNGEIISRELIGSNSIDLSENPLDLLLGCGYNAQGTGIFNGHAFKGRMDAVKVYDGALTQEQIQESLKDVEIPPEVLEMSPREGTLLDTDGSIMVHYNTEIKKGDKFDEITLRDEASQSAVSCSVSIVEQNDAIDGEETLLVAPTSPLESGKTYKLTVPVGAVKSSGDVDNLLFTVSYSVSESIEGNAESSPLDYWVVKSNNIPSSAVEEGRIVVLSNGLVERRFDLDRNFLTTSYINLYTSVSLLDPQNLQADTVVTLNDHYVEGDDLDGATLFNVGGLGDGITKAFEYDSHTIENTEEIFHWEYDEIISNPAMKDTSWPAKGAALVVNFKAANDFDAKYQGVTIQVRYEIYEGIPVISKRVTVTNAGSADVVVQRLSTEVLPINTSKKDALHMESNFDSGNENHCRYNGRLNQIEWESTNGGTGRLISRYGAYTYSGPAKENGPSYRLGAGEAFEGYRLYELFRSNNHYEWQQMEVKKMYRVLFPQTTDNPTIYHLISSNEDKIKEGIDQAKEAGFNMVLLSFGSGVNVEDVSDGNIAKYKRICDYAHERDILVGSYTMLVSRGDQGAHEGYDGIWNRMRCMTSLAAENTMAKTLEFIEKTGLDALEIDGTYPNTICTSTHDSHIGHEGKQDAIVKQWEKSTRDFLFDLREMNVYINAPDWMYSSGANKGVMGYREAAFGHPRERQLIYGRQLAYYGTYSKLPSMGWTIVPFSSYNGGDAAVFWPYDERTFDYDFIIALNMLSGISGSYRGANGLYQGAPSQNVMSQWSGFSTKYKDVLGGDIVHIAPPIFKDGDTNKTTDIDGILHAEPTAKQKGLVALYNQTGETVTKTIKIPLYYTGLTDRKTPPVPMPDSHYRVGMELEQELYNPPAIPTAVKPDGTPTTNKAVVCQGDINGEEYIIDSNGDIELTITMEPNTYAWYTVYDPADAPTERTNIPNLQASVEATSSSQVTFKWNAIAMNGNPLKDYNIFRDGVLIGKSFTNSYTDKTVSADAQYSYSIAPVYNTVQGAASTISVSTGVDTQPPTIETVKAITGTSVRVMFNEPVEQASALNSANYAITGGTILSVKNDGASAVILTLQSDLTPFTNLDLTVNNVKDVSGNVINANSISAFVYGYLRHFKMDEDSGNTIVDTIEGKNGLIAGDSAVRVPGAFGKALKFDGTKTYVDVDNIVNTLDIYAVSGWFKPDALGEQTLIGQQRENTYEGWIWHLSTKADGSLVFEANNGKGQSASEEVRVVLNSGSVKAKAGEWNHFALVREEDQFLLYLNGNKVDEAVKAGIDQKNNPFTMWLGAFRNYAGGEPTSLFSGLMDEVTFYNTAITASKVKELHEAYAAPITLNKQPLIDKISTAKAEAAKTTVYTADSITALKTAITRAEGILASATIQVELDDAVDMLTTAIKNLVLITTQPAELNKKILTDKLAAATVEAKKTTTYTYSSLVALNAAISDGEKALKTAKLQKELDDAVDVLTTAIKNLVLIATPPAELNKKILTDKLAVATAEAKKTTTYTYASLAALNTAIADGEKTLETAKLQKELDDAVDVLTTAIKNLVLIATPPAELNKKILTDKLAAATVEAKKTTTYTYSSLVALNAAIAGGEKTLETAKLQKELDDAVDALAKAIDGLVLMTATPKPGGSGGRPSGGGAGQKADVAVSGSGGAGGSTANTAKNVTEKEAVAAIEKAVEEIKKSGKESTASITVNLKNPRKITLSTLQAMSKKANGTAVNIQGDSMVGKSVGVRISIDPSKATKDIDLSAATDSARAKAIKALFNKYFSNKLEVVCLGQQESFGTVTRVAAKVDLKNMDAKNLVIYSYNQATNKFVKLENPKYFVDKNGYLQFETILAGDIIVSDGALAKK